MYGQMGNLGIEPTHDIKAIRKRYSELVKLYHPEDQQKSIPTNCRSLPVCFRERHGLIVRDKRSGRIPISISVIKKKK